MSGNLPNLNPADLLVALSVPVPTADLGNLKSAQEYLKRQELLTGALLGKNDPGDYLDCLATQNFSVDQYLSEISETLEILE